jgi:hypothetical protein
MDGAPGRVEHSVSWWLGDWWAFGEKRYGERKAVVDAEDWSGPSYQTCRHAAVTAGKFELCRRRHNLSFKHHAEVVGRPPREADRLLNWCEEPIAVTGKPRPIADWSCRLICLKTGSGMLQKGTADMKTLAERKQEIQDRADAPRRRAEALAEDINDYLKRDTANRFKGAKMQDDGTVIVHSGDKNLCLTPIQENDWRLHGELPSGFGIITDHDNALDAILEFLKSD